MHGKFLSAQPDGRAEWNRDVASTWEYFHIEERQGGKITLKSAHGKYVSAQADGSVQINREAAPPGGWEEFTAELRDNGVVCLKSCHGKYLSAQQNGTAQWNRDHAPRGGWEDIQIVNQGSTSQVSDAASRIQQHTNTGGSSASTSIEPIQILEAVSGKPIRFKLNNPPSHNEAWVGIYPKSASDQDHGEHNQRWKYIRDIDVNNVSLANQAEGDWSIRVFSDGGYTLVERKDFFIQSTHGSRPTDATSRIQEQTPVKQQEPIEIVEAVTGKPVRFKLNNPPNHNDAWVGIYNPNASDQDHGAQNKRWKYIRDIDVNNASFPKQAAGSHSIRVFSDGGHTLHERKDFTVETVPLDPVAVKSIRKKAKVAIVIGIIMFSIGFPLFMIALGPPVNLGMLVPSAIMFGIGALLAIIPAIAISLVKRETKAPSPEEVKSTRKKAWIALAIGLLLLAPGIPLFIMGFGGGFQYEAVSSGTFEILDEDGQGDYGFEIFIEGEAGDFDGNGLHDYCEKATISANHTGSYVYNPGDPNPLENPPDESREVFYLEIAGEGSGGCGSHHYPEEANVNGITVFKIGRACNGCKNGTTTITAQNQEGHEVLMWIRTEENQEKLGMLIPGAIIMGIGSLTTLVSVSVIFRTLSKRGLVLAAGTEAEGNTRTYIEVLSFNHNQPIRFKINNPPLGNSSWVGIYPGDAGDRDHEGRWQWLRDIEVDNATLPGQTKGSWSIRVFSDAGYTLHERVDFEILEGYKDEVWMKNARIEDSRIKGDMIDHPTFGNMNRRTSRIIQRARHGNVHRIETNNTTYLLYDEDLQEEINDNEPFWEA